MPQVMVVARNFMDMVAALPAAKLDMLYDSAFICEAVLRRKEVSYKMNNKFQANMQKYLVSGGCLPREPLPISVTGRLPTLVELENYALDQWECFLLQLINSSQVEKGTTFSSSMMKTFQRGLLSSRDGEAAKLSENGFQFLLMETNAQLWYIMREYISSAEERGVDPTDLISFLLELSFHTQGAAYSLSTLTEVQRVAIMDLMELGLVKLQQGRKDSWFIPTKLATNLSSSLSDSAASKEGIVVVETNFRLYAYSASKLHCEILRLFSRVEYQLPNLIVGAITKESLYGAFDNGITAEQIRLWENDRNRVEMVLSHVYEDFPSKDMFEQCCDHARDNGYLLWEDAKKMRLIVNAEFHQEMREFLRRQR
ncbi:unnamed protein product [Triticum turgidum subsp. durum]|uniref:RNA polymerase II transcription factor B subunit 2 n=1 Tax=Triticum turgidum subsp. durum TaxID=4567 RepID=A0A9R1RF41_TRITD|nr:unnamed protein product [Triticum turgidum subsp. durum]